MIFILILSKFFVQLLEDDDDGSGGGGRGGTSQSDDDTHADGPYAFIRRQHVQYHAVSLTFIIFSPGRAIIFIAYLAVIGFGVLDHNVILSV